MRMKKPPPAQNTDCPLQKKLGTRLFFRLFWIFFLVDIFLCTAVSAAMLSYCENKAASAAEYIEREGLPSEDGSGWMELVGIEVSVTHAPEGFRIPWIFSDTFPDGTSSGLRKLEQTSGVDMPFFRRLSGLVYHVYPMIDGTVYDISVSIGPSVRQASIILLVFLILQFLYLILRAFRDAGMIRRTLDPITELTRTAQTLESVTKQLDPDKMAALAGKLEGINAARLDTRISVEDTQDELKNLARAINGMLDRINESYRAQVRFVSDASHELRTPISVIQGYANLLDRWGKHDKKALQESITAIRDEASNMKDLIEQLLFLARGDNNTIALQTELFSLKQLAEDVVSETMMIDAAHTYVINTAPLDVLADKALIKQALRILIDNAIKYTDPGGTITVSTSADGAFTRLTVQDDGIGICPEVLPRIFDRFYRADESRARATGGAGLGLSIAKWIASRHGGHMEILSREGLGTRISIMLPASGVSSVQSEKPAAQETAGHEEHAE